MQVLVISPAYGRDYATADAAKAAFLAGKDFTSHAMHGGTYVTVSEARDAGYTHIQCRYARQSKVTVFPIK